jgi:hypothetical protein
MVESALAGTPVGLGRGPDRVIEEVLGDLVGVRRCIKALSSTLRPGERLRTGAAGFLEGRSGLVAATTERLLFLRRGKVLVDWEYRTITGFRARAGIMAVDLQVESEDLLAVIRQIHPRERLTELAEVLGRSVRITRSV